MYPMNTYNNLFSDLYYIKRLIYGDSILKFEAIFKAPIKLVRSRIVRPKYLYKYILDKLRFYRKLPKFI